MARALALAAALAGAAAKVGAPAAGLGITMAVPPSGSAAAITGTVTGATADLKHGQYKVAVLTSGDGGQTFWDKSHGPYRNHQLADPGYDAGDAQNAGVVINGNWTWRLANYQASPNDATSDIWVAFLVPQSYTMSYPQYQIEGVPIRADLQAASLAWVLVSKAKGTLGTGAGSFPGVGAVEGTNPTPAASPAAPAASPAAPASSPVAPPAASPDAAPAASPTAAVPSAAALPASSSGPAANGTLPAGNGTVTSGAMGTRASALTSVLGAAVAVAAAYVLA